MSSTSSTSDVLQSRDSDFTKGSRLYIYLTSIIPFIIGIVMIIYGLYHMFKKDNIYYTPSGSIKIDHAKVIRVDCVPSSMVQYDNPPCTVRVHYVLNGQKYDSSLAEPRDTYKVNDDVTVCVDENNHSVVTRIGALPTISPKIFLFGGMLLVFIVAINNWLVSRYSTLANVEGAMAITNAFQR